MAERSGGERKASAGRQGPRVAHKWPRQVAVPVPPFPGAARAGSKLPARGGPGSCRQLGVRAWERRVAGGDRDLERRGESRERPREGAAEGRETQKPERTPYTRRDPSRSRRET